MNKYFKQLIILPWITLLVMIADVVFTMRIPLQHAFYMYAFILCCVGISNSIYTDQSKQRYAQALQSETAMLRYIVISVAMGVSIVIQMLGGGLILFIHMMNIP